MTRWTPTEIVGGAYSDDTKPFSAQDTVNYMVVQAEKSGTRSPAILRSCPGMRGLADTTANAPIRGMHNVEGILLVVAGTTLYRVDNQFICHAIGTIPGVGRVSMAHNQVTGGNQVAIANGQSGYVYKTTDGSLVQITDDAFPGAVTFEYADSYILGIEPGQRFAFTSDLADALSYSTLDREEAESAPDALIGQGVSHREWWLFGSRTTEIWINTGQATGTWQRSSGTGLEVGVASPWCISNLDNSIFWLGSDGIVYRANGYAPQRISTFPIEQAISRSTLSTAFSFTFEDRGHKVFYLTLLDGHTWGYDVATQEWHRRESFGLDRWRISDLVKWNGLWVAGDMVNGRLYALDWDVQTEAEQPLVRSRTTGVLSDAENAVVVNAIALVIDTGLPVVSATFQIHGDVANGETGTSVQTSYTSVNGRAPYRYSVVAGTFPAGLSLAGDGTVTGNRTTVGAYSWTVQAVDANGVIATLVDNAVTYDMPPVYTGTFNLTAVLGVQINSVGDIVPKGQWKLAIAAMDLVAGSVKLYVDGAAIGTLSVTPLTRPAIDVTVAGIGYDNVLSLYRGLMWGVGVLNGLATQADIDALWNNGNGRSFDRLANEQPGTFSKLAYGWQMDEPSSSPTCRDVKGRFDLSAEPFNCRATIIDPKFGTVSYFNHQGRMRAIGTANTDVEDSSRVTYFGWVYSGTTKDDDFPSIVCRYTGFVNFMGLRSFWVSD